MKIHRVISKFRCHTHDSSVMHTMGRVRTALHLCFALAFLNIHLTRGFGWSAETLPLMSLGLLCGWTILLRRDFRLISKRSLPAMGLLVIGLAVQSRWGTTLGSFLGGVLNVIGFALLLDPRCRRRQTLRDTLSLGAALAFVGFAAHHLVPEAWVLVGRGTDLLNLELANITTSLELGATAWGLRVVALFAAFLVAKAGILEGRIRTLAGGLLWLLIATAIHRAFLDFVPPHAWPRHTLIHLPWLWFTIAIVPFSLLIASHHDEVRSNGRPVLALTAGCLCALAVGLAATSGWIQRSSNERIVFYGSSENAILNWDVPRHGTYGPYSQGMFGTLVKYLRADGFDVCFHEDRDPAPALEGADLFVLINCHTDWQPAEIASIRQYVDKGGSLLVLGDHTDVQGTMVSNNALLRDWGVELRFDSALPSPSHGWKDLDVATHSVLSGVDASWRLGWGVGASLLLDPLKFQPLLIGPMTFSDKGDRAAIDRALLGDYALQADERIGDLIVAATADIGRGRVTVFGDTSGFQNSSISELYDPFVRDLFTNLAGTTRGPSRPMVWLSTLVALLAASASLIFGNRSEVAATGIIVAVTLGLGAGRLIHESSLARPPLEQRLAVLDFSHFSRATLSATGRGAIGGLLLNLERSGFTTRVMRKFDPDLVDAASLFVTISPVKPYGEDATALLLEFMSRGGVLIAASGYRERSGLQALLDHCGVHIGHQPVGAIPLRRDPDRMRRHLEFVEAWPVLCSETMQSSVRFRDAPNDTPALSSDNGVKVHASYRGIPLVVSVRQGQGAFCVVGDTRFFESDNLDSSEVQSMPNIAFLHDLVTELSTGDDS